MNARDRHKRIDAMLALEKGWYESQKGAGTEKWGGAVSRTSMAAAHRLVDVFAERGIELPSIYPHPVNDGDSLVEFEWTYEATQRIGTMVHTVLKGSIILDVMEDGSYEASFMDTSSDRVVATQDFTTSDPHECARFVERKLRFEP